MLTNTHTKRKTLNLNYNLLFSSSSSSYLLALSVRIFLKTLINLVKYTLEKNSKKFPIFFLRRKDKICGKNKHWSVRERLGKDVVLIWSHIFRNIHHWGWVHFWSTRERLWKDVVFITSHILRTLLQQGQSIHLLWTSKNISYFNSFGPTFWWMFIQPKCYCEFVFWELHGTFQLLLVWTCHKEQSHYAMSRLLTI